MHKADPVSYTHLDVYKRQTYKSVRYTDTYKILCVSFMVYNIKLVRNYITKITNFIANITTILRVINTLLSLI